MKIKNIYIGSWFPKTKLHLDEFHGFLQDCKVNPELDQQRATALHRKLKPENISSSITAKDLAEVSASNTKGYQYSYYEDGLLLLKSRVKNFRKSRGDLVDFYQNILTPCLAFVFSRGAKGLEIIRLPKLPKKIFTVTQNASSKSIEKFLNQENEKIQNHYKFKLFEVFFSENLVIINLKKTFSQKSIDGIIQELIFLTEINRHFYWLLQTHRYIWDEAEKILESKGIKAQNIPTYIENLTRYYRNTTNVNSRIDQMSVVLNTREKKLQDITDKKWQRYFENKFRKTKLEAQYIKKLFLMTSNFLKNNINYLSSIYQQLSAESNRKLQFLFLANVVSAFLTLGTIFGANIYLFNKNELVLEGSIDSFNFSVMLSFVFVSLLITSIIYFFWNRIFRNIRRPVKK